jgi:hypothetical protein
VEYGLVKLVALRIWAPAVECRFVKPWVWWQYHPKAGKITLQGQRMLLATLEKETKAWVSPTHARPLHLHWIQFFVFVFLWVNCCGLENKKKKRRGSKRQEKRKKKIVRKVK